MGKPESLITYVGDRPGQVFRHTADASKAQRLLGWTPRRQFRRGPRSHDRVVPSQPRRGGRSSCGCATFRSSTKPASGRCTDRDRLGVQLLQPWHPRAALHGIGGKTECVFQIVFERVREMNRVAFISAPNATAERVGAGQYL